MKLLNLGKCDIQASKVIRVGKVADIENDEAEKLMAMYPNTIVDAEKHFSMTMDDSLEVKNLKETIERLKNKNQRLIDELEKIKSGSLPGIGDDKKGKQK